MTGSKITSLLKPEKDDYFILKPKHSGFFSSNLEVFLKELKVTDLVICGIAGNICVLFTVVDAHMRGFKIHVPRNCIASNTKADNHYAINQLKNVFKIKTAAL
jgi:nicotinamidase-related amidase